MNKKIVVTGAAGFIGSGVVRHLNDLGHEDLVLVDELDHPDKRLNLLGKKFGALLHIAELSDWLEKNSALVSSIIHLGACSDTLETNVAYLQENNTLYTERLARFALKNGIRFITASSAATYGDGSQGFSDDHARLSTLKPLNLYGKSKHLFDLWAQREGVLDQIVSLKYFNVFGPNENHKGRMASMVYKMVPLAQKEGVVRLYKSNDPEHFQDGEQCRDFIYVKDAARMTCDFLTNTEGGIFNIGMGRPTTWNELAKAIFKALGQECHIEYIEMPEALKSQYQNYTRAEMSKYLTSHPHFSFAYDIEKGVQDYVQEHLLKDRRW